MTYKKYAHTLEQCLAFASDAGVGVSKVASAEEALKKAKI
jgi:hypothetical protein